MTERKQSYWEEVQKRFRSHNSSEHHLRALELSYKQLPDYLKPCFLYFGAFPEDTEIPAKKLAQLWIAEGFVQPTKVGRNSPEDEAENYLNNLVDRSLVMIAKRSTRGELKACRIHDLLHDFCLARAKQENFLLAMDKSGESSRFHDYEVYQQYRLSIHCNMIPQVSTGYFESLVRTLLISESRGIYEGCYAEQTPGWFGSGLCAHRLDEELCGLNVVTFKFRLLRVLDLGDIKIESKSDFATICQMVHLRFLSLVYQREIPAEISNLNCLETFLLDGAGGVLLPKTIWNMTSLRHLHIGKVAKSATAFFRLQYLCPEISEKGYYLDGLTTISTLLLHCDKDVEKMMRMLPNLRKMGCIFAVSWNDSLNFPYFPALDFLNQLESLKISLSGKLQYPCEFNFPSNLKKLTLSKFSLQWEAISVIRGLPNLEVLKLLDKAFEGQQWDMRQGEFQKLKFLKLDLLDVAVWNASCEHLPLLEQLVLHHCKHLKEVPSAFGEIPTLKMINVTWCNPSVNHSVRHIQEEQHDMGNDQLNVCINPPIGNDCSFITGKDFQRPKDLGKMNGRVHRRAKSQSSHH